MKPSPDLGALARCLEGWRPPAGAAAAEVETLLRARLYRCFSRQPLEPATGDDPGAPERVAEHIEALSAANPGRGVATADGRLDADGRKRVLAHQVWWRLPASAPGQLVAEWRGLQPGYYFALGDRPLAPGSPLVRVYWHLRAEAAADLVRLLSRRLGLRDVPFRLKTLADPAEYTRADAAVLYVPRADWPQACGSIATVYRELAPDLRPAVPLLTRRLVPGLAIADDPGESFGEQRCRLLARALLPWRRRGHAERLAAMTAAVEKAGLDPARPHLEPGMEELDIDAAGVEWAASRELPTRSELALRIAGVLVERALIFGGRCAWLGPWRQSADARPGREPLGPALGDGSAGLALFASQVEEPYRELARLAWRQTLRLAPDLPPDLFWEGQLGVAWASRQIVRRLPDLPPFRPKLEVEAPSPLLGKLPPRSAWLDRFHALALGDDLSLRTGLAGFGYRLLNQPA